MPISEIQAKVLRQIAKNRDPGSYVAGATVLHRRPHSPRYSQDLDVFHDLADHVAHCAQQDAAINKVLALAGRTECRDYVDTVHLHHTCLSLGAMAWAASGKDPGYTAEFLLDRCQRHTAYSQADLDRLNLRERLDIKALKADWIDALEQGLRLIEVLPSDDIGCLYLDSMSQPIMPNPSAPDFASLRRHKGSVGGAWPTISREQ